MKRMYTVTFTDPIMQRLVSTYPQPTFANRSEYLYEALIESIISQQLSIKAADTIFERFKGLFAPSLFPTPNELLAASDEKLRTAGISFQKISYLKSVANASLSGILAKEKIDHLEDEEVIQTLTQIRGVGKWTAEMTLIFSLGRPDVFSLGDLGIRNAITKLYGITDKKEMLLLSENWKPHRSSACWYLWRSLENKK